VVLEMLKGSNSQPIAQEDEVCYKEGEETYEPSLNLEPKEAVRRSSLLSRSLLDLKDEEENCYSTDEEVEPPLELRMQSHCNLFIDKDEVKENHDEDKSDGSKDENNTKNSAPYADEEMLLKETKPAIEQDSESPRYISVEDLDDEDVYSSPLEIDNVLIRQLVSELSTILL
jgi:hypothetical protein